MKNYNVIVEWAGKKQTIYLMPAESELDAAIKVGIHWHAELSSGYVLLGVKEAAFIPDKQFPQEG